MMFGFIRKTVSTLTWPVRTAATYLLQNAVKKDLSWAIKPLIWLGADCNATFNTVYNQETRQYRTETILSYAILNNKSLATWLLSLPAIKQQVKNDATYKALITVTSCIVKEGDDATHKNLNIEQKLLELKHISAAAAASALEQHETYGIDTAKQIIISAREENVLHESNNIILNTAIKLSLLSGIKEFKSLAIDLLKDPLVKAQLEASVMSGNQDFNEHAVTKYLKDSGIFYELVDSSWIIERFAQALDKAIVVRPRTPTEEFETGNNNHEAPVASNKATIVAPPMLTGHDIFIHNKQSAFNVWSKSTEPTMPTHLRHKEEFDDNRNSQSPKNGSVRL